MSQYYRQPPSPFRPPEQNPEEDYYEEAEYEYEVEDEDGYYPGSGDSLLLRAGIFAGGCLLAFVVSGCCLFFVGGLWMVLGTSEDETAIPGSDLGLSFEDPAYFGNGESVVSENNVTVKVREVNPNADVPSIPPVEGREIVVLTVEIVNRSTEEIEFNEGDFLILNQTQQAYEATSGAIDGALGRGFLPPGDGLEGRLVFEVRANEFQLTLQWEDGPGAEKRYILLQ